MFEESIGLLLRHYGYVPVQWVYGYVSFLAERRGSFFHAVAAVGGGISGGAESGGGEQVQLGKALRYWGEWVGTAAGGVRNLFG